MLSLIIGPPRAGKTYKAVKDINDEFEKFNNNSSKYRNIYCNIGGFKYEKFNDFVKKFDKNDFIQAVNQEYTLNKQYESGFLNVDGDYDKYALNNGIYEKYHQCLIILDEAYNIFSKKFDECLGRFLSYHGHFGIDIVFLLQSKRQTNREYLVHTELLYVAQPSGKRLLSTLFRYKIYSTYEDKKDNLIKTENLKFNKKISEIYNSGSTQIYKSYATGKILFVLFLFFVGYLAYKFISPPSVAKNENVNFNLIDKNISNVDENLSLISIKDNPTILNDNYDFDFYKITCFSNNCKFSDYVLDLQLDNFLILLTDFNCNIVLSDKKSLNYVNYYVSCPSKFLKFISKFEKNKNTYKGSQNEDFKNSSSDFSFR